jgi:hypothetical protein
VSHDIDVDALIVGAGPLFPGHSSDHVAGIPALSAPEPHPAPQAATTAALAASTR